MTDASPPISGNLARLTLRTLGDAGLYADGAGPALLGPGKPFALLVYLALAPGRRSSREFLLDLLWADLDPERARRALRQTLFHLRKLIGEERVIGSEELSLSSAIEVDRDLFLRSLEHDAIQAALEHYGGAFLPTFGVPGGAAFEQWADLERGRLQTAFLRAGDIQVRRLLSQSRFREGQRLARAIRDLVPDVESVWRLVLEASIGGSDLVGAAVEADALDRWASTEQQALEPATQALVARARGMTVPNSSVAGERSLFAELTGREKEFFAITSAWESCRTGRTRHLHLNAPAGLGKSRLLRDACARLGAGGAVLVRVHPTFGDREIPYAFAADLAAALSELPGATGVAQASAATLVALNPALSGRLGTAIDHAHGEEMLRRRMHALADLVGSIAHEQPFVLAIDDLHWIDAQSHRILEGVLTRIDGARVLCLTAARPERRPMSEACETIPLPALLPSQVDNLISALGSLPEAEWTIGFPERLHDATGGSPLLVLETLRLALDHDVLELEQQEWRCLDRVQLESLLQSGVAMRERIRGLPAIESWILALLASAGTPLDMTWLEVASERSRTEVQAALASLAHHGLAICSGERWTVVHDEIAAAARDALPLEKRVAIETRLGEQYSRTAGIEADRLLRAARHFLAGQDHDALERIHRRYAAAARVRGDRRSYQDLAAELTGDDASAPRVQALVRTLPRIWRAGLWSPLRQAAALALIAIVPAVGLTGYRLRSAEEAALQRLTYVDSTRNAMSVAVRAADWDGASTPVIPVHRASALVGPGRAYPELPPAVSPDGRSVAWVQDSGDSTTLDIWIRTPSGTRRLTSRPRDDRVQGWLADGSALIGTTMQWSAASPHDSYDIAVFDTATGAARQVTHGLAHDTSPFVSPDGTRIVFGRAPPEGGNLLCIITLDGLHEPECRSPAGVGVGSIVGWAGLDEIAVVLQESGAQRLYVYDWSRDVRTLMLTPDAIWPRLSPDRRWIVTSIRLNGNRSFQDVIIRVAQPGKFRAVEHSGQVSGEGRWWEGPADAQLLIDHVEFTDSVHEVLVGVGTRLRIKPLTAAGVEVPIRALVAWTSSDTVIASVDSTGEVRARTNGTVLITANIGGWRAAAKRITIATTPAAYVIDEQWDTHWMERWLPWGDPQPVVTSSPDGTRALWTRGDGTYPSMAVLRQAFSARNGLGFEIRLSLPLTGTPHQRMRAELVSGVDIALLTADNQRKAPATQGNRDAVCGVNFPGVGKSGATKISLAGGQSTERDLGQRASALSGGAWWTLRIQIFPDGRCGVAINGEVIRLSSESIPLDREFRTWLGDESAGTKLLHGPLKVWTGVRTDLPWGSVQH